MPIPVKVEYDEYYLKHQTFAFDLKILFLTAGRHNCWTAGRRGGWQIKFCFKAKKYA
ncbi:MAG: hypothetical protein KKH28_11975 [Elusimicrobia bacterium]|nr:hypothetical protein [Elusimicrobiota bacterium]